MASLVRAWVPVLLLPVLGPALAGCGGDEAGDGSASLVADVGATEGGLVDVEAVACGRQGDQLTASGIVRNRGDNPHHVTIAVRFVDGDGVRVELTSDSVSDLQTGESARWDVSVYAGAAPSVVGCEVVAAAS